MEREKKFLVKRLPENYESYKKANIEQFYLSYYPEIRFRKANEKHYLTIKSNGTLIRREWEIRIFKFIYDKLRTKDEDSIIKKTRYYIPYLNKYKLELDIYVSENLITVEIEFKNKKDMNEFIIPDWFGEEVTNNLEYKNKIKSLSKRKGGLK
jgi:CYTH domain-containing protein